MDGALLMYLVGAGEVVFDRMFDQGLTVGLPSWLEKVVCRMVLAAGAVRGE
jgi:hypothetical protein